LAIIIELVNGCAYCSLTLNFGLGANSHQLTQTEFTMKSWIATA